MEELKPCPFCGEKPDKRFYFQNKSEYFCVSISCPKCHTSKEESIYLEGGYSFVNPSEKFIEVEEKAIKKWNQRNGK